jgi:hypothetical protein
MKTKKAHGGARKGAGRPSQEGRYRHQINIPISLWLELKEELTTSEINKAINEYLKTLKIAL